MTLRQSVWRKPLRRRSDAAVEGGDRVADGRQRFRQEYGLENDLRSARIVDTGRKGLFCRRRHDRPARYGGDTPEHRLYAAEKARV